MTAIIYRTLNYFLFSAQRIMWSWVKKEGGREKEFLIRELGHFWREDQVVGQGHSSRVKREEFNIASLICSLPKETHTPT